ncbi:MAG: adenine phosphoribosyltransferase [Planctomycetota bacterium]|jgi:adenine phosphoribosyltransferase
MADLESFIRDVPDFPKEGIIFKDITPLLANAGALQEAVKQLAEPYRDQAADVVVGVESRGFIFGPAVACELGAGFVPTRKPGKLPWHTIDHSYELEYGTDTLEMHADAIAAGQRVVLIDDLIATGGTMAAVVNMVRRLGGEILGASFLVELCFLHGRDKLEGLHVRSLIKVDGE